MGQIHEDLQGSGCSFIGEVSTDGYSFDSSRSVVDGKFVGAALDEMNEPDQTDARLQAWIDSFKDKLQYPADSLLCGLKLSPQSAMPVSAPAGIASLSGQDGLLITASTPQQNRCTARTKKTHMRCMGALISGFRTIQYPYSSGLNPQQNHSRPAAMERMQPS